MYNMLPYLTYNDLHSYRFDVDAKYNAYKILYRGTEYAGASHGDEICYLFR